MSTRIFFKILDLDLCLAGVGSTTEYFLWKVCLLTELPPFHHRMPCLSLSQGRTFSKLYYSDICYSSVRYEIILFSIRDIMLIVTNLLFFLSPSMSQPVAYRSQASVFPCRLFEHRIDTLPTESQHTRPIGPKYLFTFDHSNNAPIVTSHPDQTTIPPTRENTPIHLKPLHLMTKLASTLPAFPEPIPTNLHQKPHIPCFSNYSTLWNHKVLKGNNDLSHAPRYFNSPDISPI